MEIFRKSTTFSSKISALRDKCLIMELVEFLTRVVDM
jgi:hypothetical protein